MLAINNFKTSVNIKFDIGDEEFIRRYLPTPSHADAMIGLSKGFSAPGNNTSHIMIGPYGSGKSLVATIIANFVSGSINNSALSKLANKFNKVHQEVHQSLLELSQVNRKYIPVTLSGSEGNFSNAIINSILSSLQNEGIELSLPNKRTSIEDVIENWFNNYKSTYDTFSKALESKNTTYVHWIARVNQGHLDEISWFETIYPSLTAGAEFTVTHDENFLEQIEFIINKLEEIDVGIFIVYDEFGRFLQSLDYDEVYKAMQDIQDLAEVANRSNQFLHILLISHKNMSQYMFGLYNDYHSEFLRIEKRFATYFIESDTGTYFRFVENFIRSNVPSLSLKSLPREDSIMKLRKFNLFEELNQQELEMLILEGSHPIHPVTLFLLPRLSKAYGQNERTLFTFLENKDSGGLLHHIKNSDKYYFPNQLFNYFFPKSTSSFLSETGEDYSVLKTFNKITAKFQKTKNTENAYRILKIITLWQLSHSNSIYRIDKELLAFATMLSEKEVEENLLYLTSMKFIRFNRILKQWELVAGSSVQIDELVSETIPSLKINRQKRLNYLQDNLSQNYIIANRYNDSKNITRFFRVKLIFSNKILQKKSNIKELLSKNADGYIYLIILNKREDYQDVLKKVKTLENEFLLFSILTTEFTHIKDSIDTNIAIQELLLNTKLLSEYENLQEELTVLNHEHSHQTQQYLDLFFSFQSNTTWIYNGKRISMNDILDLKNHISSIMDKKYYATPIIMNDSINRMHVKGIQKRSLLKVLDHILNDYTKDNLNIEGQGPDYLIYATLIKNLEVNFKNLDKTGSENLRLMRKSLLSVITNKKHGDVLTLKNTLSGSPFGIREPLIPIFIVMLLRDVWEQIIFYKNNMFVPALDAEKIYELFNEPDDYEYEYHHYTKETTKFLHFLEDTFKDHISEYVIDETPLIKVSSGLLNWLRSLPRQTQITNELSEELLKLKEVIRRSEINPLQSVEELKNEYYNRLEDLTLHINQLNQAFETFTDKIQMQLLDNLSIKSFSERESLLKDYNNQTVYNNRLLYSLSESNNFSDFITNYIGVELSHWSDTTSNLFESQIKNDIENLKDGSGFAGTNSDKIKISLNNTYKEIDKVDLSRKSEIILNNVDRMIKNAGRTVSDDEVNYILYKLINTYLK